MNAFLSVYYLSYIPIQNCLVIQQRIEIICHYLGGCRHLCHAFTFFHQSLTHQTKTALTRKYHLPMINHVLVCMRESKRERLRESIYVAEIKSLYKHQRPRKAFLLCVVFL